MNPHCSICGDPPGLTPCERCEANLAWLSANGLGFVDDVESGSSFEADIPEVVTQ